METEHTFTEFYKMPDKNEQNEHLASLITINHVQRYKKRNERNTICDVLV